MKKDFKCNAKMCEQYKYISSCRGTTFHHVSKKTAASRLNQQDKYDDQDGLSDLDDSQESSPCPASISDITTSPHLQVHLMSVHCDTRLCMIIIQWTSQLTTTRQLNHKFGGSC
jgi:hypothetical protein